MEPGAILASRFNDILVKNIQCAIWICKLWLYLYLEFSFSFEITTSGASQNFGPQTPESFGHQGRIITELSCRVLALYPENSSIALFVMLELMGREPEHIYLFIDFVIWPHLSMSLAHGYSTVFMHTICPIHIWEFDDGNRIV